MLYRLLIVIKSRLIQINNANLIDSQEYHRCILYTSSYAISLSVSLRIGDNVAAKTDRQFGNTRLRNNKFLISTCIISVQPNRPPFLQEYLKDARGS